MANSIDTDCFKFNDRKLFVALRNTIAPATETQNIVECKDDMIFVWNAVDCNLMCFNWRAANARTDDSIKYQTLLPSSPQNYMVDKITPSQEGSYVALSGRRGIAILELPRRYGPNGTFSEGRDKIICRSHNLDDRLFTNNIQLEVLQVRWHPASPKDSHLLVLLSNNSIRVYDEEMLLHVWRVGPLPVAMPPSGSNVPYLNSLGDTAVDFDIAPPRVVATGNDGQNLNQSSIESTITAMSRVQWPLVILRGNGTLYILSIGIETAKPQLQGPLSVYPATDDNYGLDSCSLIVLPSLPPTIILSETTGKIHHGLLMDSEEEEEQAFNDIDASLILHPCQYSVQVLETVKLELGIAGKTVQSTCPIHLKRDFTDESRYFAYHNTGLHAITVNFVRDLQSFVDSDDSNIETTNMLSTPSRAEYLVCTKAVDSSQTNPVLGFTQIQSPSGILLLLASGQVVSLSLIVDSGCLREPQRKSNATETKPNQLPNSEFESHIKSILVADVLQPILKLNTTSEPSAKESFELLTHAVEILREQYFPKLNKVRTEIDKRVKHLMVLKEQQKQEIAQLQKEKEKIRENAERLADRYEDVSDKQQSLFKRAQEVVRLATLKAPDSAQRAHEFQKQIEKINALTKALSGNILMAKKKMEKQNIQVDQFKKDNTKKTIVLQPKVERTIMELLTELHDDIRGQTEQIMRFKEHLNMS
ncbi:nuclear pore complex protein Nup88 isoform X2 [Bradysia coprophila]|uniref:nuclear pore complex protein Nup88 isoform X2 n=1 Tax=Bradysia coprophila TaxID=38358 RepID=UPI00187D8BCA|nr:nuclear pore complex protein Nup88 isoform X2 [Bradysia coprophila]